IASCTTATILGSLAVAAPAAADRNCPYGTVARFDGVCTSGQGGSPPPPIVVPPQGAEVYTAPGSIPSINGIPCNDAHWATCYAMQQNGG
ncbi:MAG: hypothetical protein QOD39_1354, partial [Mycobacterium sp.]|nr:hypothetical protein [Mycobacterium sp.]